MSTDATIPATLPAEFVDRTVYLGAELDFYRLELGGVVSFDGRLDESRLRRALRLLLDAEPVLGCRFVADSVPPVFQRLDGLDSARLLETRDSADPSAEAAAFIAEPFDPHADPQVLALLLRGPSSDVLAVKVGHLATDGGALKVTLYLLSDIYRTLGGHPDWTPAPNVSGVRCPLTDAGLIETIRSFGHNDLATPPSDWWVPLLGGRGKGAYVSASVEPEVFRAAVGLAKSAGATVNDVILAAYYRALYRLLGAAPGSRTPLMVTVDLRRHLPEGTRTALANISSVWWVSVPPVADEGFDGTLARVVAATREWKSSGSGRASAIGIPVISKLTRRKGLAFVRKMLFGKADPGEKGGAVLTNIGVVDDDRLDFGPSASVKDAWLLAPVTPAGVGLGASTYRDRLRLSAGADFAAVSEALVTDAVVGTAREIESWVAERGRQLDRDADRYDPLRSQG